MTLALENSVLCSLPLLSCCIVQYAFPTCGAPLHGSFQVSILIVVESNKMPSCKVDWAPLMVQNDICHNWQLKQVR